MKRSDEVSSTAPACPRMPSLDRVQFKSQVSVYEHRVRDTEDIDRRARAENVKLQREVDELTRERESITREMNVSDVLLARSLDKSNGLFRR